MLLLPNKSIYSIIATDTEIGSILGFDGLRVVEKPSERVAMSFDLVDSPLLGSVLDHERGGGGPVFDPSYLEAIGSNDPSSSFEIMDDGESRDMMRFIENNIGSLSFDEDELSVLAFPTSEPIRCNMENMDWVAPSMPLPVQVAQLGEIHDDSDGDWLASPWPCVDDTGKLVPSPRERQRWSGKRRSKALARWYTRLNEWVEYENKEKQDEDPQRLPKTAKLRNWVNKCREEKRKLDAGETTTYMYPERVALLERLGFVWAKSKDTFEVRYRQLREFFRILGHANVPVKPVHKDKGSKDDQVASAVAKLLKDHSNVDDQDRETLFTLLKDHNFCRWVTQMRVRFKTAQAKSNPSSNPAQDQGPRSRKSSEWQERKRKLAETDFSFTKQKCHCA